MFIDSFMKLVAFVPPHIRIEWTLELGQYWMYTSNLLSIQNTFGIKGPFGG